MLQHWTSCGNDTPFFFEATGNTGKESRTWSLHQTEDGGGGENLLMHYVQYIYGLGLLVACWTEYSVKMVKTDRKERRSMWYQLY